MIQRLQDPETLQAMQNPNVIRALQQVNCLDIFIYVTRIGDITVSADLI